MGIQLRDTNFVEHGPYDGLVAEPVGAHQEISVHPALRQTSCMLERRRRRLYVVDGDPVANSRKKSVEVSLYGVIDQAEQLPVTTNLRQLADQQLPDGAGKLGQPVIEPT